MNSRKKVLFFGISCLSILGGVWYWGGYSVDGLGSSALNIDTLSCTVVPGKVSEIGAEKKILSEELSQIRNDIRTLNRKKTALDIPLESIKKEQERLDAFEKTFFKNTQYKSIQDLRAKIEITQQTFNSVSKERMSPTNSFVRNRLLSRHIRVIRRERVKQKRIEKDYTLALAKENQGGQQKNNSSQNSSQTEVQSIIAQIAQKEIARQNYQTAIQELETLETQLATKNATCLEAAQERARQESANREQNTVSTVAADTNTNTNANTSTNTDTSGSRDTNTDTNVDTSSNSNTNTNVNTVQNTQTTPVMVERGNTVTETVNTSAADVDRSNTETVASTGGETATTNTTPSASVERAAQQTVTNQNTVTTSNTTTATNTTTNTVSNTNTTTANNTQTSANTNTNTAANITVVPVAEQTLSASSGTSGQNTSIESGAIKQDIFMNVSGLPDFTEFSEARNPLRSLIVSNSSNKLINVTGGQICWFSAKQIGNIQNLIFWTQQSWEGYKSIFLDQIYFYFDKKPTSNYEEPFSITTYIGRCINANDTISRDCWIESSYVAKRSTEDRKYQTSQGMPFTESWLGKKSLYFSYHANFSGIRTLSTGGTSFDRDFIFYGCVDKNEPIPKF